MVKKKNNKNNNVENTSTKVFKNNIWIVSTLVVVAILIITSFYIFSNYSTKDTISKVCVQNKCYDVEIADTKKERAKGLMFRNNLPLGSGMLFKYNKLQKPGFWMKNTNFPLDIVWIGIDKEIVDIKKNFQPCISNQCKIVYPKHKVKYVLEINSGQVKKNKLEKGQEVYFK